MPPLSGGYSNIQDITTFEASTLQGDFRITERYKKTETFIYDYLYRRVAVNPNHAAGFGGPDSVAVAAGARGWAGGDVVS